MKTIDAATAAAWSAGSLAAGSASTAISAVSTDTRRIIPGSLFVALAGDRFDAHDFLPQAQAAGAVLAPVIGASPTLGVAYVAKAFITVIGIPVAALLWLGAWIWKAYRLIRGFLDLNANKAMPV